MVYQQDPKGLSMEQVDKGEVDKDEGVDSLSKVVGMVEGMVEEK